MNIPVEINKDDQAYEMVPRIAGLNQWYICITETDLEAKLREALEAAQKAGHDLDVTFTGSPI